MKKETIKAAQTTIDFMLGASDINGCPEMFEFIVPAGAKVPVTYYHEHFEETIYGLERIITFTVEAKAIDIAPGEIHFIPRNAVNSN
jgi:quercetin dioxygenase-like cupin family protein